MSDRPWPLTTGELSREALPLVEQWAKGEKVFNEDDHSRKAQFVFSLASGGNASMYGMGKAEFNLLGGVDRKGNLVQRTYYQFGCLMLVVNDMAGPLQLELPIYEYNGTWMGPNAHPYKPKVTGYIPGRSGDGKRCGVGVFLSLGSNFKGTAGAMQFKPVPGELDRGLRLGWSMPKSGTSQCGLSIGKREKSLSNWWSEEVSAPAATKCSIKINAEFEGPSEDDPDKAVTKEKKLKLLCAQDSMRRLSVLATLLSCHVEEKKD